MKYPSACGSRWAKTPRPRSVASSSSRRTCRRRSRPCAPAATTSRAICISIASALRATRLAKSRSRPAPVKGGFWLGYAAVIDGIRETIDKRMRAELPGDEGSIASALITGKRDAISTPVNDAMYVSSLAHVLSISGYHMAVVAGIVSLERSGTGRLGLSTAGTAPPACPGCARGWAAGCAPRRRCWPARARSRRRGGGSA